MAIGNSIDYSIPTVGTTVGTVNRSTGNTFTGTYVGVSGDHTAILSVRPASPNARNRQFGITMRVDPSLADDPGVQTKGACTVAINISTKLGTTMTAAEVAEFTRKTLSAALKANLIEDLCAGTSL